MQVELDSEQFFLQGFDLEGNPVAYFNSMCPGPWRMDVDAQILAVLHRLESAISYWSRRRAFVQFTLIVLIGKIEDSDKERKRKSSSPRSAKTENEVNDSAVGDDSTSVADQSSIAAQSKLSQGFFNPRIDADEEWRVHGNYELAVRLVTLAQRHYPERFYQCFVVARGPWGTKRVDRFLTKYLESTPRLREKITVMHSEQNLKRFISADELVKIAGGNAVAKKVTSEPK